MDANIVAKKSIIKINREKGYILMKLEEIAQVMIGILTKREKKADGKNSYQLFSLKNYEENQTYEKLETDKDLGEKLSQKEDLLFRLVYPNKIIYVDEEIEGMLIPSQFCIIRTIKSKMNPIVLKWYLESGLAKDELNSNVTGSLIKSMSVSDLKKINIPVITKEQQENMKKLIELWKEEKEVLNEIIEEKEKLYNSYLEKIIIKENKVYDKRK